MSNDVSGLPQTTGLQITDAQWLPGDECTFADTPAQIAALDQHTAVVPLSPYGLLAVEGVDAEKFLQGQITCSSAEVSTTLSSPGAYCTAKGRIVTSFQLLRVDTYRFLLRMRRDLLDSAAQTLSKYIVFSKAKLSRADELVGIGLNGPNAAALVREFFDTVPVGINATISAAGGFALQRDEAGIWFECWLPQPAAQELWQRGVTQGRAAGTAYWHWLNIRAGLAEVSAASADTYIPQMLNYHLTGAVNFKKGCYTGQEIVARAYYRGQVKRHLIRAALSGPAPAVGAAINDANGRAVGSVVNSVATGADSAELLGVCGGDADQDQNLQIDGVTLQPLTLPYAIP
jgi:folate-binding protein YgfZ